MGKYTLVNVENRHDEFPDTFEIPSWEDRHLLCQGDLVQLFFDGKERMWVEVRATGCSNYSGILVNDPVSVDLKRGDVVKFGPEHIAKIDAKEKKRCSRA